MPLIHSYDISLFPVATGGFATIYKGTKIENAPPKHPEVVAIKMLSPCMAKYATNTFLRPKQRLEKEINILNKLNDQGKTQHVVRYLEDGELIMPSETTTRRYLMLEWLEGMTLQDYLKPFHPPQLPINETWTIFFQLLAALKAIHSCHVVHRDIRPANLMFGKNNILKIIDFGICLQLEKSRLTIQLNDGAGIIQDWLGCPPYLPPEQFDTKNSIGFATDLYAAGVVLLKLLTGKHGFERYDNSTLKEYKKSSDYIPPQLNKLLQKPDHGEPAQKFSESIQKVIDQVLAQETNKRFENVDEFRSALEKTEEYRRSFPDKFEPTVQLFQPSRLRSRYPTWPVTPQLQDFFDRALHKEPEERFESYEELKSALRQLPEVQVDREGELSESKSVTNQKKVREPFDIVREDNNIVPPSPQPALWRRSLLLLVGLVFGGAITGFTCWLNQTPTVNNSHNIAKLPKPIPDVTQESTTVPVERIKFTLQLPERHTIKNINKFFRITLIEGVEGTNILTNKYKIFCRKKGCSVLKIVNRSGFCCKINPKKNESYKIKTPVSAPEHCQEKCFQK